MSDQEFFNYVLTNFGTPYYRTSKPVSPELCLGGTEVEPGCKQCGDVLYMTVTGREGQTPPYTYEAWRLDHDKTGLPWAKERMLDHMTAVHMGVLAEDWKPLATTEDTPPKPVQDRINRSLYDYVGFQPAILMALSMWFLAMALPHINLPDLGASLFAFIFVVVESTQLAAMRRRRRKGKENHG